MKERLERAQQANNRSQTQKTGLSSPARSLERALRSFKWWCRGIVFLVIYHWKRHYHLHLTIKNSEIHWRASAVFKSQDRRAAEENVPPLHGTLERALTPLKYTMYTAIPKKGASARSFRGKFLKAVRQHRGLSHRQLCRLLNSHPALFELGRRHPSYWIEFPFTPAFIERFEEKTESLLEEATQGFLFGVGFPTENFIKVVGEICCAEEVFGEFKGWYQDLENRISGYGR